MNKRFLFILRHHNDVDHVVPIIHALATTNHVPINVLMVSNEVQLDDFRLQLLSGFKHVRIYRLPEISKCPVCEGDDHFTKGWAESLLATMFPDSGAGVLAMDWIHASMRRELRMAGVLLPLARKRGIVTVSLPHGDSPHTSVLLRRNEILPSDADCYAPIGMFDHLVVPNELCAKRYRPHLKSSRLHTLGSPRFNHKWLEILDGHLQNTCHKHANGRKTIVLFLRHYWYPLFWDEILWSLRLIASFPNLDLIISHHTRHISDQVLFSAWPELAKPSLPNVSVAPANIYSGYLVRTADLVLDTGTSMSFEAVMLGKPVLDMKYLYSNRGVIGSYMPECMALCRDDLYHVTRKLAKGYELDGGLPQNRKKFIKEMIYANQDGNVLDRYVGFLKQCKHPAFTARYLSREIKSWENPTASISSAYSLEYEFTRLKHSMIKTKFDCNRMSIHAYRMENMLKMFIVRELKRIWLNLRVKLVINEVWLYGAGKHTLWLIDQVIDADGPRIVGIIDDTFNEHGPIRGIPVLSPQQAQQQNISSIIPSTDVPGHVLFDKVKEMFADRSRIIYLYQDWPPGPYPK